MGDQVKTKKCKECGKEFEDSSYHNIRQYCNKCPKIVNRRNKAIYQSRYKETEAGKITEKKYKESEKGIKNTEKWKSSSIKWRGTDIEKEWKKKYRNSKKGRIKRRENQILRRLREKRLSHLFTQEEWEKKVVDSKGICESCKKYVGVNKITQDHCPPVSKAPIGFKYNLSDVACLCGSCNASKNNKDIVFRNNLSIEFKEGWKDKIGRLVGIKGGS